MINLGKNPNPSSCTIVHADEMMYTMTYCSTVCHMKHSDESMYKLWDHRLAHPTIQKQRKQIIDGLLASLLDRLLTAIPTFDYSHQAGLGQFTSLVSGRSDVTGSGYE